ncbi:MAG: MFS transporter [Chlorobi bacterium]|nr:MFS transporter [Chlorobiota bacterium]
MLKSENKFKIFIWTLFDFANTSYSIIVVTFIYAVYFKDVVAGSKPIGDLYWSIGISISMLISGILAPILGAIADYSAGKKRFLLFFTLLSIVATSLLYFISEGMILWGLVLFIIANIGFESGLVFYDSFLPELTEPKNYGRVSGYGFAMGYLGSLATLAIVFPFIQNDMIKETFPISALFFLIFAAPLFIFLKDSRRNVKVKTSFINIGFRRVKNTVLHLRNYKNLALFLLAFFFYIEGVNTTIFFSGNFAKSTLGFSFEQLALFFLIVQTTAIIGSIIFGVLSDSIGQKKSIVISLYIWIFTMILAYLISDSSGAFVRYFAEMMNENVKEFQSFAFYVVGLLAGSVMGATQSVSRSLMSKLTPKEKKTEFFGFYSLFGKSSAIFGPLVFGLVSFFSGSQALAILSISLFFIVGLIILRYVDDEHPESAET